MARVQELHPHTTLTVLLLACAALEQPVAPHDLVRLALGGGLPFLHALPK